MTSHLARSAAVVLALTAGPTLLGPSAHAEAPVDQGWWTTTNRSDSLPVTPPGSSVAVPPDVPPDGLLVQGGADAPTAYAGLVYDVVPGLSPDELVLEVAPGSVTTPDAGLRLCPLQAAFLSADQGGPMSKAPSYDCTTSVSATPSADGTRYSFGVSALAEGGTLAVAVLPVAPTDRVVLAKPGSDSLATSGTPSGEPAPPSQLQPPVVPGEGGRPVSAPPPPLQPGHLEPGAGTVTGPVVAPPQAPGTTPPEVPSEQVNLASSRDEGNGTPVRGILLALMLGLAGLLWGIAGRQPDEVEEAAAPAEG